MDKLQAPIESVMPSNYLILCHTWWIFLPSYLGQSFHLNFFSAHLPLWKGTWRQYVCISVLGRSVESDSATPWTVACQAPLSMGFPRQGYLSGFPFPSPENLPNPGIKPMSLASPALAVRFFNTATWEADSYLRSSRLEKGFCKLEWVTKLSNLFTGRNW